MTKALILRFHRWISLVFALPLLAIIATGVILSVEPLWQASSVASSTLDAKQIVDAVRRLDPDGKARGLAINAGQILQLQGIAAPQIDLATGETVAAGDPVADLFLWARRTHERLIGQSWLVIASTVAMVTIMLLGTFMGLPRLRNTLSGWHKAMAWFTLPLILLSPLTGLCMAFGLTFMGSASTPAGGKPPALLDAIRLVAQSHDLSHLISIGTRGGRMMARLDEDGELRTFTFGADGLVPLPHNWPRLIHEGNWSAVIGSSVNLLISAVLLGLLVTGVLIWFRRQLRRPSGRRERAATSSRAAAPVT